MSEFKGNERISEMLEMHENGSSYEEIGKAFSLSRQRVFQLIGGQVRNYTKEVTPEDCIYPNLRNWLNKNCITRFKLCRMIRGDTNLGHCNAVYAFLKGENKHVTKYTIDKYLKVTGLTYEELFETDETNTANRTKCSARAIFEEFKTKIQAEINTNFVLEAYGDERAEGKVDAYRKAIDCLDEMTKEKVLSVRQEDELYEKGYNDALKDVEEMLTRGKK